MSTETPHHGDEGKKAGPGFEKHFEDFLGDMTEIAFKALGENAQKVATSATEAFTGPASGGEIGDSGGAKKAGGPKHH